VINLIFFAIYVYVCVYICVCVCDNLNSIF
jgi:hypothetical protein